MALLLKGQMLEASGDISAAIKEYEKARQSAPEDRRVRWALLRVYTAAGRREDAERIKAEIEKATPASNK
jgi:Flp pilus assembly protein TadD